MDLLRLEEDPHRLTRRHRCRCERCELHLGRQAHYLPRPPRQALDLHLGLSLGFREWPCHTAAMTSSSKAGASSARRCRCAPNPHCLCQIHRRSAARSRRLAARSSRGASPWRWAPVGACYSGWLTESGDHAQGCLCPPTRAARQECLPPRLLPRRRAFVWTTPQPWNSSEQRLT